MTLEDRSEVREMLNDIISAPLEKIAGQYRLMTSQLSNIEIQTTKTNGRVTALEENVEQIERDIFEHPVNCDKGKDIEMIKNFITGFELLKSESQKKLGNILKIGMFVIGFISLIILTYNSFRNKELNETAVDKIEMINDNVENIGVPMPVNNRGEPLLVPDSTKIYYWPKDSSYMFIIKKVKNEY